MQSFSSVSVMHKPIVSGFPVFFTGIQLVYEIWESVKMCSCCNRGLTIFVFEETYFKVTRIGCSAILKIRCINCEHIRYSSSVDSE